MKPPPFTYERADSVDGAVQFLADPPGEAKVIAGGQSLVALMNMRLARPDVVLDINRIDSLRGWKAQGGWLCVGATTTQADLERDEQLPADCPLVAEAIPYIGHSAIRNRGTVGGTIAHADPAAELPVVLTALGGEVVLQGREGRRSVVAEDFFIGFLTTAMDEAELLTEVRFPLAHAGTGVAFEEFARRPGDFALVSVACMVEMSGGVVDGARIALGGVAPAPQLIEGLDALRGLEPAEAADRAAEIAREAVGPAGDIHGSAEYREHLSAELVRRAFGRASEGIRS